MTSNSEIAIKHIVEQLIDHLKRHSEEVGPDKANPIPPRDELYQWAEALLQSHLAKHEVVEEATLNELEQFRSDHCLPKS